MTEEQRLFVADAQEIVERLQRDLEELRVARSEGRRRRELAAQVFRRIHTLKGSGASLVSKTSGGPYLGITTWRMGAFWEGRSVTH